MDNKDQEFWDRLVRDLGIPPDLREHIENRATRDGASPWDYILLVLRRDADGSRESGDHRD